jgi:hypothetical protein
MCNGKFLTAECPNVLKFDMYLLEDKERTYICGAYWSSFTRAYNIQTNDVVHFHSVSSGCLFDVFVSGGGSTKPLHERPGIRTTLRVCLVGRSNSDLLSQLNYLTSARLT